MQPRVTPVDVWPCDFIAASCLLRLLVSMIGCCRNQKIQVLAQLSCPVQIEVTDLDNHGVEDYVVVDLVSTDRQSNLQLTRRCIFEWDAVQPWLERGLAMEPNLPNALRIEGTISDVVDFSRSNSNCPPGPARIG